MWDFATSAHGSGSLFHASATSLGALFVGVGAFMLIIDALGPASMQRHTWGGDVLTRPLMRLVESLAEVGAVFVGVGSILLLIDAANLSFLTIVAVVVGALLAVYFRMCVHLWLTERSIHRERPDDHRARSLAWCLAHPMWTSPNHRRPKG